LVAERRVEMHPHSRRARPTTQLIPVSSPLPAPQIKRTGGVTKFKVRCSKYLYTLCVPDSDKADKLKQSLPPGECLSRGSPALLPRLPPPPPARLGSGGTGPGLIRRDRCPCAADASRAGTRGGNSLGADNGFGALADIPSPPGLLRRAHCPGHRPQAVSRLALVSTPLVVWVSAWPERAHGVAAKRADGARAFDAVVGYNSDSRALR